MKHTLHLLHVDVSKMESGMNFESMSTSEVCSMLEAEGFAEEVIDSFKGKSRFQRIDL